MERPDIDAIQSGALKVVEGGAVTGVVLVADDAADLLDWVAHLEAQRAELLSVARDTVGCLAYGSVWSRDRAPYEALLARIEDGEFGEVQS